MKWLADKAFWIIGILAVIALFIYFRQRGVLAPGSTITKLDPGDQMLSFQQIETLPQSVIPSISATPSAPPYRTANYTMQAGTTKITGIASWTADKADFSKTAMGNWVYILKNQVIGQYRFVIAQWANNLDSSNEFDWFFGPQTEFFIFPAESTINWENKLASAYVNYNTGQFVIVT